MYLPNAICPPHTTRPSSTLENKQFLFGLLIMYRSTTPGVGPSTGNKDPGLFTFQAIAWSVFLISMGAQVLGQTSLLNGPALFIRNVVGFALFPIYLDGAS